ncbi:MAG: hypothetical protein U0903_01795 [Planctomycetales bacterium]
MALPLLLLMFVLIMSVAVFSLGYLKATIVARANAWDERPNRRSQLPMSFSQITSKGDIYSRQDTENPVYPSAKINFGSVSASHAVLGGSWDYHELLKGNGPHWEDMGKAGVGGATNQISSILDQFANGFDIGSIPGLESFGGIQQLLDQGKQFLGQLDGENEKQKKDQQQNIKKMQDHIKELQAEKKGLQDDINNNLIPKRNELNQRIADRQKKIDAEKDPDKKKALQKEQDQDKADLKQTNQQITQKQNRIKEIDNEINAQQSVIDQLQGF